MSYPRGYKSFADFERDAIRPGMRVGWSMDEFEVPDGRQEHDFDLDPFEEALLELESDDWD